MNYAETMQATLRRCTMEEGKKVIDRGALYYPFIHVRDEKWLKATLLCFPFVDRMVPDGYEVNDGKVAAFFAQKPGRLGRKMLSRRDLDDPATEHARTELLGKLQEDLSAHKLADRFSRAAAKAGDYADGENAFQIHEYKFGSDLLELLRLHDLVWEPTNPVRGNARWWAVHPALGEAIISTNAVALAKAHDLEIVTSDGPIHQGLLGSLAPDVYDILVRREVFGMPRSDTGKVNDLMRFVIVSAFDLDSLSLEDIAEMNRQRSDLSALKAALLTQVEDVGAVPDREVWNDLLSVRAKEVVEEWGDRQSILHMVSRPDAKELASEFKSVLQDIAPVAASGAAVTGALLGALPGLVVGVVFGAAYLVENWRASQRPYRFLSRLAKKGTRHVLEGSPA
jgi:hypothetical protein